MEDSNPHERLRVFPMPQKDKSIHSWKARWGASKNLWKCPVSLKKTKFLKGSTFPGSSPREGMEKKIASQQSTHSRGIYLPVSAARHGRYLAWSISQQFLGLWVEREWSMQECARMISLVLYTWLLKRPHNSSEVNCRMWNLRSTFSFRWSWQMDKQRGFTLGLKLMKEIQRGGLKGMIWSASLLWHWEILRLHWVLLTRNMELEKKFHQIQWMLSLFWA